MQYITYKFYDGDGRRLAIFYQDGKLTIIPCNKKDQFSTKKAKELFLKEEAYKETFNIEFKTQMEFQKWCEQTFSKYYYFEVPGIISEASIHGMTEDSTIIKILA